MLGTQKAHHRGTRKTIQLRADVYDDLISLCQDDVRPAGDQVAWLVREERNRRIAAQPQPDHDPDQ